MNLYQRAKAGHEPREDDPWFLPTTKTSHVHLEEDEVVLYQHDNVNRSCYVHTVHTNETVQGNSIVYEGIVEYTVVPMFLDRMSKQTTYATESEE